MPSYERAGIAILPAVHANINQNYLQFKDSLYKPPTGLAMGHRYQDSLQKILLKYYENLIKSMPLKIKTSSAMFATF
jgi:hypothetical protein